MFATTKAKVAAAIVLAALMIVPAPLLPPLGLAAKVQSILHVGWKAAYLASFVGLHIALYGSLGVVAAFAVGPGKTGRQRLLQLVIVPVIVVAIAVLVRSVKLRYVPVLSNAFVPIVACVFGVVIGLLFRQNGWRATVGAIIVLAAGLLWAFWPGASSGLGRSTEAQLRRMIDASPGLPAGDERFGVLVRTAFEPMPSGESDALDHNRAAILALGIALGHERLARYAGLDRNGELVRSASSLRSGTTLRGREDWVRHYCVSAALVIVENPFVSDTGGLIKEELDALAHGSGFSFGDLAADRAGARFATVATDKEWSALAVQARLRNGFSVDDFFPSVSDLPENLTTEQFRLEYGGVGSRRFRETADEIEARLNGCAALSRR